MLIIVSTVFRQLIQKVLLGLGPRIGFELVKATKVVEGIASERKLIDCQKDGGVEYLIFVSSRSLKMREKYTN